jgi:RNA polymerase sigma-70 factor (ECF subfamily)
MSLDADARRAATVRLSLDNLFRSHGPRLQRFLRRRLGNAEDAADLLQECFIRLVRAAQTQPSPANAEAYLVRIASNLVRDRARRSMVRCEAAHVEFEDGTVGSPEPDPEATLSAREMLARYEAALDGMSAKTRSIFLRHRLDGLTYQEIAKELNQSVSNVEKHMMKAIAHLDRALEHS